MMRDFEEIRNLLCGVAIGLRTVDIDYASICDRAADAIEELLKENAELENSGRLLMAAFARLKEKALRWHQVSEQPTRSNPKYAREDFLVHLESGKVMSLTYEFDNSDRCRTGFEPLFPAGWRKTASPVTHWANMPKFEPQKEVE